MNLDALAAFGQVCVGTMNLHRTLGKGTCHDGRAADVFEATANDGAVADIVDKVKRRGCQVMEQYRVEDDVVGIPYGDGTDWSLYPCLILQPRIPRQPGVILQFIRIDQREAALQGDVPLV